MKKLGGSLSTKLQSQYITESNVLIGIVLGIPIFFEETFFSKEHERSGQTLLLSIGRSGVGRDETCKSLFQVEHWFW